MNCGIYKITCKETDQCYIGQSKNIEARWKAHQKKRFSVDAFDYEILVTCQVKDLNDLEILMIETFDSHRNGFNKTLGGSSMKVIHKDPETLRKMSENRKGKGCNPRSEETKRKISDALRGKRPNSAGKPISEETRRKLSEAKKGKKCKPLSEETKRKISEAIKAREHNKYIFDRSIEDNCSKQKEGPRIGTSQENLNP